MTLNEDRTGEDTGKRERKDKRRRKLGNKREREGEDARRDGGGRKQ